jgi:hypothetical protein
MPCGVGGVGLVCREHGSESLPPASMHPVVSQEGKAKRSAELFVLGIWKMNVGHW